MCAAVLFLTACGNTETTNETVVDTTVAAGAAPAPTPAATPALPASSSLTEAGTIALVEVRDQYLALKDAFVATDGKAADQAAQSLATAGEKLKIQLGSEHQATLTPQVDSIITNAKQIAGIKDDNAILGKKRAAFEHISNAAYHLFQNADLTNSGLYVQHCPMAFKNKGASWLAAEQDIRNPYYGDKMLECGEVTETMK